MRTATVSRAQTQTCTYGMSKISCKQKDVAWHKWLLTVLADGHVMQTTVWLNQEDCVFDPDNDLKHPSSGSNKKRGSSRQGAHS